MHLLLHIAFIVDIIIIECETQTIILSTPAGPKDSTPFYIAPIGCNSAPHCNTPGEPNWHIQLGVVFNQSTGVERMINFSHSIIISTMNAMS